jgi:hypothetical protein
VINLGSLLLTSNTIEAVFTAALITINDLGHYHRKNIANYFWLSGSNNPDEQMSSLIGSLFLGKNNPVVRLVSS